MSNKIKIPLSYLSIYPPVYVYTNKNTLNINPQEFVDLKKIGN